MATICHYAYFAETFKLDVETVEANAYQVINIRQKQLSKRSLVPQSGVHNQHMRYKSNGTRKVKTEVKNDRKNRTTKQI